MTLTLYPAQQLFVDRYLGLSGNPKKLLLSANTGTGKTAMAIRSVASLAPSKTLVVCPAIVRRHWVREFGKWWEENPYSVSPIEMGRERKSGTKKALATRDAAYQAPYQVVSYDLLGQVNPTNWDMIVMDEIHHLADPLSRQSQMAQKLVRANPDAHLLGLSATLIPTEVRQLWHPLWLFWGDEWGKPARTGDVSWQFQSRYCHIEKNEYGTRAFGCREDRRAELAEHLSSVAHRLTREDISAHLPPLDVSMLEVPGKIKDFKPIIMDWLRTLPEDITHACVLVYHRVLAQAIAEAARGLWDHVQYVDGSMPTGNRDEILSNCAAQPRSLLVGTYGALDEGIRLMWCQETIFAEWRTSPKEVQQVLGRFQSVGSTASPRVHILTDEDSLESAQTLLDRVDSINALLRAGPTEKLIHELFQPKELSSERLADLTREMLDGFTDRSDWESEDESGADSW